MSSRFFGGASDSEDSDDDNQRGNVKENNAKPATKFDFDDSSSDDEDRRRVVKSGATKITEEIQSASGSLRANITASDFVAALAAFEKLSKAASKQKVVSPVFISSLSKTEEALEKSLADKEGIKKLSKPEHKALTQLKTKVGKDMKKYESEVTAFRSGAAVVEERPVEAESESESEEDVPETKKPAAAAAAAATKKGAASDDDSDHFSDDSDSDSDVDIASAGKSIFTREFWVKTAKDRAREEQEKKNAMKPDKKPKKLKPTSDTTKREVMANKVMANKVGVGGAKALPIDRPMELNAEAVAKKLKEILEKRGKKGTDRNAIISDLRILSTMAKTPFLFTKIKVTLMSTMFETVSNRGSYIPLDFWMKCVDEVNELLQYLQKTPEIKLTEDDDVRETEMDDDESVDEGKKFLEGVVVGLEKKEEKKKVVKEKSKDAQEYVAGNIYSFIHKLCSEFWLALQNIDHHTPEYMTHLSQHIKLIQTITLAQGYYESLGKLASVARVALERLELVYYIYVEHLDAFYTGKEAKNESLIAQEVRGAVALAELVYKHGGEREKVVATLCHVYHLCIRNEYARARDCFLMSHVQESIHDHEIKTRILYNRTLAQFGMCAFRCGEYRHALNALSEIYPQKAKELLAQGVNRQHGERNLEKELIERRRQYPFHMHLNLDVVDTFRLLSAMFEEIPSMALPSSKQRRVANKTFRHQFTNYLKQAFSGPPENIRDGVMASAVAVQQGDWQTARKHIFDLPRVWEVIPNAQLVKRQVALKIQDVCLRTYLLTYGPRYATISVPSIVDMFRVDDEKSPHPTLDQAMVLRVISEMILSDQLHGAFDESRKFILMSAVEPTPLQKEALNFTEKLASLLDQNERASPGFTSRGWDHKARGARR